MHIPKRIAIAFTMATVGLPFNSVSADNSEPSTVMDEMPKGVYRIINAGGPGCRKADEEFKEKLETYRAWHFCYTYRFTAEADFFTDVTNIVFDGINILLPLTKYVDLYQPNSSSIRFQVTDEGNYRVYDYWKNVGQVPPPGKYTDHKFINVTDTSIDYWWKLKQRGTGKNARIYGVAEVTFIPDELYDKAKEDGFSLR